MATSGGSEGGVVSVGDFLGVHVGESVCILKQYKQLLSLF